jgi:hypothetical protein
VVDIESKYREHLEVQAGEELRGLCALGRWFEATAT